MNNVEFLSFTETPNDRTMGIATIRFDRRFIFRFKINENPKGEGFFSNAPSLKIDDQYYPAFAFDSNFESDEVKKFVINNVKKILDEKKNALNTQFTTPSAPFFNSTAPQNQAEFSFPTDNVPF